MERGGERKRKRKGERDGGFFRQRERHVKVTKAYEYMSNEADILLMGMEGQWGQEHAEYFTVYEKGNYGID